MKSLLVQYQRSFIGANPEIYDGWRGSIDTTDQTTCNKAHRSDGIRGRGGGGAPEPSNHLIIYNYD